MSVCARVRACRPHNPSRCIVDFLNDLTTTHHSPLETSYHLRSMPHLCRKKLQDVVTRIVSTPPTPEFHDGFLWERIFKVNFAIDTSSGTDRFGRVRQRRGNAETWSIKSSLRRETAEDIQQHLNVALGLHIVVNVEA